MIDDSIDFFDWKKSGAIFLNRCVPTTSFSLRNIFIHFQKWRKMEKISSNQIIELDTEVKNQEMRRTLTVGSMIDDSIDFSTGRNREQYFQIDACLLFLFLSVIFLYISKNGEKWRKQFL